jgi:hypothetical protein
LADVGRKADTLRLQVAELGGKPRV